MTLSKHAFAYKAACEVHPKLKSFDSSLQERTNNVVNSMTAKAQGEMGSLSVQTSYMEVYGYLLDVSQDVAKFVTDSKADVWEDEDLRSLVKAYFKNTTKTLEFFSTVQKCVNKAEMGKLIIQAAVQLFDKESAETGAKKKKYEKTLEELKKFKDMKEDFDGDKLKTEFELVKKEQESLLDEVSKLKKKIDEDIQRKKKHKKIANYFFAAAVGAVIVIGLATAIFGGGALVPGAIMGMAALLPVTAIGWVGTYTCLQRLEEALIKKQKILKSVDGALEINKEATMSIYIPLQDLLSTISSILDTADFAMEIKEEETIKLAMHLIKGKVEKFIDKIIEAGKDVDKFSKLIIEARYKVLEKIKASQ